jgi:hypothetical protein
MKAVITAHPLTHTATPQYTSATCGEGADCKNCSWLHGASHLSTPLSTRHFMNYQDGEIYGVSAVPERFHLRCLTPRTAIRNLYLTGQDVCMLGVAGALMGGVLTASAVLGRNLMPVATKPLRANKAAAQFRLRGAAQACSLPSGDRASMSCARPETNATRNSNSAIRRRVQQRWRIRIWPETAGM